jgi:hypothetical protein
MATFVLVKWKVMGEFYLYLYSFGDIAEKKNHGDFHMPTIQRTYLKTFLIMNEL